LPVAKAVALYPYTGNNPDELPFAEGDTLNIIDRSDADWWKVEQDGLVFIIPAGYVELIEGWSIFPFPELLLFTSSAMANRLKFFFLISSCMLQINDTPVQIPAGVSQYPRPRSYLSQLPSPRHRIRVTHRRLWRTATALTILTQSICHSTNRTRKIKKRTMDGVSRGKLGPLNVNEFWKRPASLLGRTVVDPLLRSPVNTGHLRLFQND
jgi:hypothetical protein